MAAHFLDVKAEYSKDKELKENDVKMLMDWAEKQPHLPAINELQAILFLQSCYYRNEAAKTALDTYFTVKTLCPETFGMRNPLELPMKEAVDVTFITTLPKLTPEGYTIIFLRLHDLSPDKYNFPDQIRNFDVVSMLHLYQKGTSKGHVIVFDMQGTAFGHLAKVGLLTMKKLMFYLQDAMPVRLKGLHFFNIVSFMDKILAIMRPFMKKDLLDVMFLHNTVEDLVKYVPRECLPQDYGGAVEPIAILHEKIKSELKENQPLFEWEESQKVDETKRPGKPKSANDVFGVEGTFKKLEID